MKTSTLVLLFFVSFFQMYAQNDATLSGLLLDQKDKSPIVYATVSLFENDQLISGSITSEEGRFLIEGLKKGSYKVQFSYVGYQVFETDILIGDLNQNFDLGKIELQPTATDLEGVTVTAQKSEVAAQLDRKSYNLSENIAQSGGSLLDAMKMMAGVAVDQEGKIILRGSDKVVVLIDGKPSALTGFGNQNGLDNIPAANIERIEIINNPSAKYDAAGMAGIINVIYKKEKQTGLNGSIGFNYGLGVLNQAKKDLPTKLGSFRPTPKYIPSLDFNYKKERSNFYLQSEILFQEKLPNNEFTSRFYDDGLTTISQVPENRKQTHYIVKAGTDFLLGKSSSSERRHTLSLSSIYDWETHVDTAQVPYINQQNNQRYRYIHWNEEEVTGFFNFGINYAYQFPQRGHELNANVQYTRGWEDETYFINDSSEVRVGGRDVTNILAVEHTTALSLDYTKPLRSGRLESGTKYQIRRLPVEYTVDRGKNSIIYEGMGDWSKWGESIYSAYLNLIQERNRFDIEAGLRAEYTTVFYNIDEANIYFQENDSYDYFELFPNLRLTYKLNEKNRVSLFYNRRVDRPQEPELRVFAKSDDHELLKVGNPYLRPQFTQSTELAYKTIWESGSIFLAAYYRFIENPFMRIYSIDPTNITYDVIIKSYANTGSATNTGLEFILSQQLTKFWKLSANLNFYQNHILAYEGQLLFPYAHSFPIPESKDNTWDFKMSHSLSLNKDWQLQLTGVYFAPKNIPQGKQLSRSSIDLGIRKKIWDGKGEVSFAFSDIFNQYGLQQEIQSDGFRAVYENYYETQVIRFGLRRRF